MRIKDFEFSLRELAGSMGDFGTLFPLAVGYIAICGMNPAGLLVMMGLTNIVTGIVYHLPMPLEPMKILAVMAIAKKWPPSLVYASAFGTGVVWLVLGLSGAIDRIAVLTPKPVTRGVQAALGLLLAYQGLRMASTGWGLAATSVAIIILFRQNRYAPAAILLMALGLLVVWAKGELGPSVRLGFTPPPLTSFSPRQVWDAMVLAGFAQVPLTLTNAVIAASALISRYFPGKPVSERRLALNMGVMNVVVPFFGGMPMCHGAGGLAGQYFFGARTGGTNIIEGLIEISLGLFLAGSIQQLFVVFPESVIGTMMFMVGLEMSKFAAEVRGWDLLPMGITIALALTTNMALGFAAGIAAQQTLRRLEARARA
ncbi:MAG: putative sulfate/molybdate transporter [Firmicutes bacterium]|jgi:MFS superfamily sulfate permease-like transporter|nr:putative sulfate/molybdate transporter [Bacillota bacterium]